MERKKSIKTNYIYLNFNVDFLKFIGYNIFIITKKGYMVHTGLYYV